MFLETLLEGAKWMGNWDLDNNTGHYISFLCNCKKLPQAWWLKTTEIYSFLVLEARSLKLVSLATFEMLAGPPSLWTFIGEYLESHSVQVFLWVNTVWRMHRLYQYPWSIL